jgi:hypothetical protein
MVLIKLVDYGVMILLIMCVVMIPFMADIVGMYPVISHLYLSPSLLRARVWFVDQAQIRVAQMSH